MLLIFLALDFAYLFVFQVGGQVSKVTNLISPLQSVSLAIVGVMLYKEHLNTKNILGIALSIVGVILISA